MAVVALVHCHVKPEHVDAFADALVANHEGSVREPGVYRFDILQQADDPSRFVIYEWYADDDAVAAHKGTAHYLAWRESTAEMFVEARHSVRYRGIAPETPEP